MKKKTGSTREPTAKPPKLLKKATQKAAKKTAKKAVKKAVKKAAKKTSGTLLKVKKTPLISYSRQLSEGVVKGMKEKKALHIAVMDLRKVKNAAADFFVLASGTSDKHIEAIAESVEEAVFKELNEWPWHVEGKSNKEWMLLDYADVVAHIFRKDRREYFALEQLWGDAEIKEI